MMLFRLMGLAILGLGLWLVIGFPFFDKYLPEGMERFGVVIGILLIGVGLFLLRF